MDIDTSSLSILVCVLKEELYHVATQPHRRMTARGGEVGESRSFVGNE